MRINSLCISLLALLIFTTTPSFSQVTLQTQIRQIAHGINGHVGMCAVNIEKEETISYNGDEKFPMQSVYKFPIGMAVLHLVDEGKYILEQNIHILKSDILPNGHSPIREKFPDGDTDLSVAELLRYAVSESDGTACDVLLRIAGGTDKVDNYIHTLGVKNIRIATTEKLQQSSDEQIQYKNWATPKSMTKLLQIFYSGNNLTPKSKTLLTELMIDSYGVKRLKGLLPAETVVAHKTGTAATTGGLTRATNDAGIITLPNGEHIAIAVFVSDSKAEGNERELTIAEIAKAVYDYWTNPEEHH